MIKQKHNREKFVNSIILIVQNFYLTFFQHFDWIKWYLIKQKLFVPSSWTALKFPYKWPWRIRDVHEPLGFYIYLDFIMKLKDNPNSNTMTSYANALFIQSNILTLDIATKLKDNANINTINCAKPHFIILSSVDSSKSCC